MPALSSSKPSQALVGLDVGGTKIDAILVDEQLNVLATANTLTDATGPAQAMESIADAIAAVLAAAGLSREATGAIGLGIPGMVRGGVVRYSVNLGMREYPVAAELAQRFGALVLVENDVRTAALGAYRLLRRERDISSLAYLTVGTGIAAGILLDGHLYHGAHAMAGEVGHVVVAPRGPRCNCGNVGCLEAVAAGPAIAAQAARAIAAGQPSALHADASLTAEAVYRAAAAGDRLARRIVARAGAYIGRAIYSLVMAYDVDVVALGGGVTHAGAAFQAAVSAELGRMRRRSGLARRMLPTGIVALMPPDFNAGLWGAIELVRNHRMGDAPAARPPEMEMI